MKAFLKNIKRFKNALLKESEELDHTYHVFSTSLQEIVRTRNSQPFVISPDGRAFVGEMHTEIFNVLGKTVYKNTEYTRSLLDAGLGSYFPLMLGFVRGVYHPSLKELNLEISRIGSEASISILKLIKLSNVNTILIDNNNETNAYLQFLVFREEKEIRNFFQFKRENPSIKYKQRLEEVIQGTTADVGKTRAFVIDPDGNIFLGDMHEDIFNELGRERTEDDEIKYALEVSSLSFYPPLEFGYVRCLLTTLGKTTYFTIEYSFFTEQTKTILNKIAESHLIHEILIEQTLYDDPEDVEVKIDFTRIQDAFDDPSVFRRYLREKMIKPTSKFDIFSPFSIRKEAKEDFNLDFSMMDEPTSKAKVKSGNKLRDNLLNSLPNYLKAYEVGVDRVKGIAYAEISGLTPRDKTSIEGTLSVKYSTMKGIDIELVLNGVSVFKRNIDAFLAESQIITMFSSAVRDWAKYAVQDIPINPEGPRHAKSREREHGQGRAKVTATTPHKSHSKPETISKNNIDWEDPDLWKM